MGLDQYVYWIKKPNYNEERVYNSSEIGCGIIIPDDEKDDSTVQDIIPYCRKLKVINKHWNMEAIRSAFDLSEKAQLYACFNGTAYIQDESREVEIKESDLDGRYTIERIDDWYACDAHETMYWRKAYDVQDWFHENLGVVVENTGYYLLNAEIIRRFNEAFPERPLPEGIQDEESALVYYEWY